MQVIVTVEYGVVQSVITDSDCEVIVVDYDTEEIHPKNLIHVPDNLKGKKAYVYQGQVQETNPQRLKQILKAIKK